jgi:hypothetical protein
MIDDGHTARDEMEVKMRNSLTRDLIHVSTEIESFYVDVALQSVKSATGKE